MPKKSISGILPFSKDAGQHCGCGRRIWSRSLWPGIPDVDSKPERKVIRQDDGAFVLDAATPISDFAELLGLKEVPRRIS